MDLDVKPTSRFGFQSPRIPHRVVVNNSTLTIFDKPDLSAIDTVFSLQSLKIEHGSDQDCIKITDKAAKHSRELCAMLYEQKNHETVIQKFKEDLEFFQIHCKNPLPTVEIDYNAKTV